MSTATTFIKELEAAKNDAITTRINSDGGGVQDTWGGIAKFAEHKQPKHIKVDGRAHSMAAFFLCYADTAECLDVTEAMMHRAGYPEWLEASQDFMTPDTWAGLDRINGHLRRALEAKVSPAKFKEVTGYTIDELFSNDGRLEIFLTAEKLLALGLVQKIVPITPEKTIEINALVDRIAAQSNPKLKPAATATPAPAPIPNPIQKNNTMTIAQLSAEHPQLVADIQKAAVEAERERVGAWLTFVDVDAEAVIKGIEEGKYLGPKMSAELARKSFSKQALEDIKKDNPGAIDTSKAPDASAKQEKPEIAAFKQAVNAGLKLKGEAAE